ncbi:putative glutathione transferase transcription factor MYB family [Helianthus debilis subsp. tardiflorus]
MEASNKGEGKKKMVGSGSKSMAQDKCGTGGSSVPFHPYLGFANQTQPPFYFNQPMHQPFGYDTQPIQNLMQHGPTMTRPGYYDYSLEAQNVFDPFSFQTRSSLSPRPFQTPRSQSPRDVQDDSDEEFVPETQEQELDEDEDVVVEENHVNENEAASERKGKAKRETWTPRQEEALVEAFVHCTLNKKKDNQQKADGFWKKVLNHYNQTVGGSKRIHHQVRSKWMTMQTKSNTFNGLYHQADHLRPSGSDNAFVMRKALKNYNSKEKIDFGHIAAWEIVRSNQKWLPVHLLGEESSGSSQKRKSSDSEIYRADTPNVEVSSGFGIPDINEDPSSPPRRQARKEKNDKGSSSRNEDP